MEKESVNSMGAEDAQSIRDIFKNLSANHLASISREREEFARVAEELRVDSADLRVAACPLVVSGIYMGRFFYLRERHGEYRVCIAPDSDPLKDVWVAWDADDIEVGAGHEGDIYDQDLMPAGAALVVAARCVDEHFRSRKLNENLELALAALSRVNAILEEFSCTCTGCGPCPACSLASALQNALSAAPVDSD